MTATQLDKKIETVLETLILKGKTSGTLPFDEIHTAIPAASLGVNALETLTEILDRIEDAGIQVAESGDAAARPPAGAPMPVATKPLSTVAHRGGTRAHQPVLEKIDDPVEMYLIDVCTLPVNIAGLPGLSIPCGFSQGLPVGMQLIGPTLSEPALLRLGYAYQQATDWHKKLPEL